MMLKSDLDLEQVNKNHDPEFSNGKGVKIALLDDL